jgi:hypothetical protein
MWNSGYYKQLVELLIRAISPIARPLLAQDDTNTEEKRTNIHAVDGAAIMIGSILIYYTLICMLEDYYTWNKWTSNKHKEWL